MAGLSGARQQWLADTRLTFAITLSLSILSGVMLGHFYGAGTALFWTLPMLAIDTGLHFSQGRRDDETTVNDRWFLVCAGLIVAGWSLGAVLFWITLAPGGWVWSIVIEFGLIIHVIFNLARWPNVQRAFLIGPFAVLFGCLVWTAWISYPPLVATASTLASIGSLLGIASASRTAGHNFQRLAAALAQVRADRERLEFAIESAGDGYFEIDFVGMVYRPNPKLAIALGFDASPKDMATLRDRVHPDDAPEAFARLEQCVRGKRIGWNQDLRVRVAAGGYRWMHLRARVMGDPNSRGLVATVVDLSERKALEAELRAAKETAEAGSRAKGEFLANMSHEIRTPLNGILGMAQVLMNDDLAPAQREKIETILESGQSLTVLLNDVLDLAKVDAGKLEISPMAGDLQQTVDRAVDLFRPTADSKGLELSVRPGSTPIRRLNYDPVRVRQCVSNLVSNAIKFTAEGRVEVSVLSRELDDGRYLIAIAVTDTGIGLSAAAQAKLFSAFTQADGATTRRFGGTGLGLAISRQLARLMGGDIVVESGEGRGSTFLLTFEAKPTEASDRREQALDETLPAPWASADSLRGRRVLLTDDNVVNRQVIKLLVAKLGLEIVEATNGREALDKLASESFDLVLLDIHMPVMDGRETIQRLRASGRPWSELPVIALTADAMSGDRERYLALGMSDYVSKPINQDELIAKLYQLLKPEMSAWAATSSMDVTLS